MRRWNHASTATTEARERGEVVGARHRHAAHIEHVPRVRARVRVRGVRVRARVRVRVRVRVRFAYLSVARRYIVLTS